MPGNIFFWSQQGSWKCEITAVVPACAGPLQAQVTQISAWRENLSTQNQHKSRNIGNLNSGRLEDISKIIAPGKLPIIQYKVTQYLGTTNWFGRMILKRHKIGWVDSGVNWGRVRGQYDQNTLFETSKELIDMYFTHTHTCVCVRECVYENERGREERMEGEKKEEDTEGRKEEKEWSYSFTITDVLYKTESDGIFILGFWYLEFLRK